MMTTPTGKYINTGDFCEVVSDKFIHEGVKRGHVVYVAGHKALPVSDEDPYTQRIKFFVHVYDWHNYLMEKPLYLVDPVSIKRFDDDKQKTMMDEYRIANNIK